MGIIRHLSGSPQRFRCPLMVVIYDLLMVECYVSLVNYKQILTVFNRGGVSKMTKETHYQPAYAGSFDGGCGRYPQYRWSIRPSRSFLHTVSNSKSHVFAPIITVLGYLCYVIAVYSGRRWRY